MESLGLELFLWSISLISADSIFMRDEQACASRDITFFPYRVCSLAFWFVFQNFGLFARMLVCLSEF